MKKWVDNDGNFLNESYINIDDMMVWNPGDEQFEESGYTEYIGPTLPELIPEELLGIL